MLRRLATAMRIALREEDFGRVMSAGALFIVIGTLSCSIGNGWSLVEVARRLGFAFIAAREEVREEEGPSEPAP